MTRKGLAGFKAVVLTVSDSVASGNNVDESGPAAIEMLARAGAEVSETTVSDDLQGLVAKLMELAEGGADLIVTSGGTGVAPRDNTPEATTQVCERIVPGLAELMRRVSIEKTPFAALSRAVAGIRGTTMIVNLPGSPGGVRDCLNAVIELLPHALGLLKEQSTSHLQT